MCGSLTEKCDELSHASAAQVRNLARRYIAKLGEGSEAKVPKIIGYHGARPGRAGAARRERCGGGTRRVRLVRGEGRGVSD